MKLILNIYKPQGLTPLQIIDQVREKFPEYKNEKIGFAGRLDPLAHGILLLMVGEETTQQRSEFLDLPKSYEFEAVFGMTTDTYDVLGMVKNSEAMKQSNTDEENEIKKFIKSKLGKQKQSYPPYSSKEVGGKPLHWWARNNKLDEIKIPEREIEIYDFTCITTNSITANELQQNIIHQINSVTGDFRQEEIKKKWKKFFAANRQQTFQTARFIIDCSSGTYIRSLVNELGEQLNCGAITLEILRTNVGEYMIGNSIKIV